MKGVKFNAISTTNLLYIGVGFATGTAVGYLVCRQYTSKRLYAQLDERLDAEIARIRKYDDSISPEDWLHDKMQPILDEEIKSTAFTIKDIGDEVRPENVHNDDSSDPLEGFPSMGDGDESSDEGNYAGTLSVDDSSITYVAEHERAAQELLSNIFSNGGVEENTPKRDDSKPYGISIEEYCDPPEGRQQITITYYATDKVLVDDQNGPIPNITATVGPINPMLFGGISQDPHIRYVRNNRMDVDFEIILNAGSFAEEVLGYGNPNPD